MALHFKLFVAFLGINQDLRDGSRFVCWFYDGNTQRLTESGFMEKPGMEFATPGLQDIGFIPYTTAAYFLVKMTKRYLTLMMQFQWGKLILSIERLNIKYQ